MPKRATGSTGQEGGPRLLAGGNPQIAKGEGEAPVQACIAATPGWKRAVAQQLDALASRAVPGLCKAVRWNSPFLRAAEGGWFLSPHCFIRYATVAFLPGAALVPPPPVSPKNAETRQLRIAEGEAADLAQFEAWFRQASRLPGLRLLRRARGVAAHFWNKNRTHLHLVLPSTSQDEDLWSLYMELEQIKNTLPQPLRFSR